MTISFILQHLNNTTVDLDELRVLFGINDLYFSFAKGGYCRSMIIQNFERATGSRKLRDTHFS